MNLLRVQIGEKYDLKKFVLSQRHNNLALEELLLCRIRGARKFEKIYQILTNSRKSKSPERWKNSLYYDMFIILFINWATSAALPS